MAGSGTVLRQAGDLGLEAYGFDMDPLAVLMSTVWTTPVADDEIQAAYCDLKARSTFTANWSELPWIGEDKETKAFVSYWFNEPQLSGLMQLAAGLASMSGESGSGHRRAAIDVLRLNLSRIIVTKEQAASLARDTSHSRPHKVTEASTYDVFTGYERSLNTVRRRLKEAPPRKQATVSIGDVRSLAQVEANTIDAVVTSPPYLNAIDYLRGHRMALVWLGWSIPELRSIRSDSIGAERGLSSDLLKPDQNAIVEAMVQDGQLPARHRNMIHRYAQDVWQMLVEIVRVLRETGSATFVVGNSCLKGVFVRNAEGVAVAAKRLGLREISRCERDLPQASRYLPTTGLSLGKRMRTECVMSFALA